MSRNKILSLFIYLFLFQQNQTHTDPSLSFSPTASPTINPMFDNTPTYNTEINPSITCNATSLSYALAIAFKDYIACGVDALKNSINQNSYELFKAVLNDFLWRHKYIIVGNTLLGSYVTTSIVLLSDYYFMHDVQRWAQWKSTHSFEELCEQPQQQLTKELLIAINQHHCNEGNPKDINHPLITFISTINDEIYRINRYITLASLQKKLHLIKLFPTNESKIKRAEQLLTRVHFIKHIFLSWLAEYNLINA